jgi:hypothetical protein
MAAAQSAWSESRDDELDDLRFAAGSSDNKFQWPSDVLNTRGANPGQTLGARPCLTVNKLPQHILQVTNDQRQNRPAGKVIPADDAADIEVAQIYDGMIKHIEYVSDADVAYDTACSNQVTYGEGYWRILTEYVNDESFEQDIRIKRIRNSFSVMLDPMIQDPCGADAQYGFISEDIDKLDYERQYPDATPLSSLLDNAVNDAARATWLGKETIRISEYFYFEHEPATLNLYPENNTAFAGTQKDKMLQQVYGKAVKNRRVDRKKVMWIKTNGYEILEENEWAGSSVPIIRVVGNEYEIEGKLYISGLVRNAKDPQRLYNYWVSAEAEMLALAPKAPFIGAGGQFEGYEHQWKTANTTAWPYLEYNPDVTDGKGAPLPPPQRSMPPMAQTGLIQAKMGASDDIKSTTGQYNSSLGATSNERSGKAIMARERQADVGTYHYVDNLARAVRYSTRQIVELIPKIYDTARIARTIGEDALDKMAVKMVKINPQQPMAVNKIMDTQGVVIEKIYNPSVGKYDVMVTTGPSYMTKRQEAMDAMATILQSNPQLWAVAGDLFIKNMDWPGAQEMAERFKRTMDPKVIEDTDKSPELQAAEQQIQTLQQETQQLHNMLISVQDSMEAQELRIREVTAEGTAQVAAYNAETNRLKVISTALTPEQMQDIVMGTVQAMIASGDLLTPAALAGMGGNAAPQGGMAQPGQAPASDPSVFMENAALPSSDVAPL